MFSITSRRQFAAKAARHGKPRPAGGKTKVAMEKEEDKLAMNKPLLSQWALLKQSAHERGRFFAVYNSVIWWATGVGSIAFMEVFQASDYLFHLLGVEKANSLVSPMFTNLLLGFALNEALEPLRFPFAVKSVKPLHDWYLQRQAAQAAAAATAQAAAPKSSDSQADAGKSKQ